MNKLRCKVYMTAGYNTVSMGTGRKEFHPKKPRPGLEDYIREAGRGTLQQVGGAANIDEGVIGNFMAARFNGQGNLAAVLEAQRADVEARLQLLDLEREAARLWAQLRFVYADAAGSHTGGSHQ